MFRERFLSSSQVSDWSARSVITLPSRGGRSYVEEVVADTPLRYWRFEEASGTYATTYGPSTATVIGTPTRATDAARGVRSVGFPSVSDYVQLDSAGNLPGSAYLSSFSWECWFKVPTVTIWSGSTSDNYSYQLIGADGGQEAAYNRSWSAKMYRTNSSEVGRVGVVLTVGSTVSSCWYPSVRYDDNVWHHIVGTFSGSLVSLYVDGVLRTWTFISGSVNAGPYAPVAGREHGALGYASLAFPGLIDEVAIYPSALSAARVLAHYQAV